MLIKVEKILKGILDSISSPSVKIQIMGGKGEKTKHCWNKLLNKYALKQTFLSKIWIVIEGEGDEIEFMLPFKIFSTIHTDE